jgi:hypothetical protein
VSLFFSCWICALVLKPSSLVAAVVFLALAHSPVPSLHEAFLGLVPNPANGLMFFHLTADPALSSCIAPRLRFIFSLIFPTLVCGPFSRSCWVPPECISLPYL